MRWGRSAGSAGRLLILFSVARNVRMGKLKKKKKKVQNTIGNQGKQRVEARGASQAGLFAPSLSAASTGGFNRAREPSTKTPRTYCRRPSLEIIIPASTYGKCLELALLCKQPDGNLETDCGWFSSSSSLQQRSAPHPLCPGLRWCWGSELSSGGARCAGWAAGGCVKERNGCETTPEVPGRNAMSQCTMQGAPAAKWGHARVACTPLSLRVLTFPGRDAIKPAGASPKPTGGGQISGSSLLSRVTSAYFSPCLPGWDRGSGQKYS